jgi:hypothetical protein
VVLRCILDGFLLPAGIRTGAPPVVAYDGDESFVLESVEAIYYELVAATDEERLLIERYYRLIRTASDFRRVAA